MRATTGSISSHCARLRRAVHPEALELGAATTSRRCRTRPGRRRRGRASRPVSATRAGWMKPGGSWHDPVAETDALRALRGGGQEDPRGAGVRVLLQEVVLDLPRGVQAHAVGELDLLQGVLNEAVLAVVTPGAGDLVLVEDPEAHGREPNHAPFAATGSARLGSRRRSHLPSPGVRMSRCARSLPLAAMVVALCLAPSAGAAPPATDGPGALSHFDLARKDCVGTARNTPLEGLVHGRRRRAQRRLLPDQRQHQHRDAAVRRHRRLERSPTCRRAT